MASITTINATDLITDSRAVINTNLANLNTDKIETSYLDTDTTLAANSDTKIPSQKAVKAYVDTGGNANASETVRGIVEEATDAEVTAGTATGATGAKLFVSPAKLATKLTAIGHTVRTYNLADSPATWTKPTGLVAIRVQVWGGGGSGCGANSAGVGTQYASGGGGGGYAEKDFLAASLGTTETVTVGAGGASVGDALNGNSGGDTTFGSLLTAYGGGAGYGASSGGSTYAGGGGGAGPISAGGAGGQNVAGVAGSPGTPVAGTGGGDGTAGGNGLFGAGGGGAGNGADSGTGGNAYYGGGGGGGVKEGGASKSGGTSALGGAGGGGVVGGSGTAGSVPGGGGGGSVHTSPASGAGGAGRCIVTEYY